MLIASIPLDDIRRRADARPMNDAALEALADSIETVGLINPIRVRRSGNGFELIAGSHRFAAVGLLGWNEIDAVVVDDDDLRAELAMIDENLCRAELSPSERAQQTARRKAIYVAIYPETEHGANAIGPCGQFGHTVDASFSANTAKATNQAERTVRRNAERGEKITPDAFSVVAGTALDKGTYLDRLKAVPTEAQVETTKRDLAASHQPRQSGGIAGRYASEKASSKPSGEAQFKAFVSQAEAMMALDVAQIVEGAGRQQRAMLTQRAASLADFLDRVLDGAAQ